jgi:hypothetical protein
MKSEIIEVYTTKILYILYEIGPELLALQTPRAFGELHHMHDSVYSQIHQYASNFRKDVAPLMHEFMENIPYRIPETLLTQITSYFPRNNAFSEADPETVIPPKRYLELHYQALIILDPTFSILSTEYPTKIETGKIETDRLKALLSLSDDYIESNESSLLTINPSLFANILQSALQRTILHNQWNDITILEKKKLADAYLALSQKNYHHCDLAVLDNIHCLYFNDKKEEQILWIQNILNPEKPISSCLNPNDSQWKKSMEYLRIARIRFHRRHPHGFLVYRILHKGLGIFRRGISVALHFMFLFCYKVAALVLGAYNTSTFVRPEPTLVKPHNPCAGLRPDLPPPLITLELAQVHRNRSHSRL